MLKKLLIFFLLSTSCLSLIGMTQNECKMVVACTTGNLKVAARLIDTGLNLQKLLTPSIGIATHPKSYIHLAAHSLQLPVMELLTDHGVPIDFTDGKSWTPLMLAIESPKNFDSQHKDLATNTIQFLLNNGAQANKKAFRDYTALSNAVFHLNIHATKILLAAGALCCSSAASIPIGNELHLLMNPSKEAHSLLSPKEQLDRKLYLVELLRCADIDRCAQEEMRSRNTPIHLAANNPHLACSLLVPLTTAQIAYGSTFKKSNVNTSWIGRATSFARKVIGSTTPEQAHANALKTQMRTRIFTFLCCLHRNKIYLPRDMKATLLSCMPVEYVYGDFTTLPVLDSKETLRLKFLDQCLPRMQELIDADTSGTARNQLHALLSIKNAHGQLACTLAHNAYQKAHDAGTPFEPELLHVLNPKTWEQPKE